MSIERICLLGLGEVGRTLAEDLLHNSRAILQVWDGKFGVADSAAQAHWSLLSASERVERADNAATAALNCQLILSAVTADEAVNAAQSVLPGIADKAWFVDFNSVSPVTKQQLSYAVEQVGGRFVEAAIMSPIAPQRMTSPILLAGPYARAFASIGRDLGFGGLQTVSESLGIAAATKMCRSVIIKGMEALVTEAMLAARYYGVDAAVLESLNNLWPRPDWPEHAHYLISRSLQHGARRAAEMREVSKTVNEAGLTPWMSESCAQRQHWAAQFNHLLSETATDAQLDDSALGSLLDAMQAHLDQDIKPNV